jgi:glycosyltransferase involved in cell wall biosynthesis
MAGMVTFQDLLTALRTLDADRPTLELVEWYNEDPETYAWLMPMIDGVIRAPYPLLPPPPPPKRALSPVATSYALTARMRRRLARALVPTVPPPPPEPADETLRQNGVDCSFSVVIEHRRDVSVPLLIWIYDLQHHHLPELISERDYRQRDEIIVREAGRATRLMVQSSSVGADLEKFLPQYRHKIGVMHMVTNIDPAIYECDLSALLRRYHLPEKFIYLPNQFWKHKNHRTVVEALRILRARGIEPVVVCTGSVADHRNPDYVDQVMQEISVYGLRDQMIVMGSIPREDVFGLMRQSIAVLNPSLFEGYGLSAAEAKSLGKRALLSDLPSLREQAVPEAIYFNPNDAEELADRMAVLWNNLPAGPELELERRARAALLGRQRKFARSFLDIVRDAIQDFHTPTASYD